MKKEHFYNSYRYAEDEYGVVSKMVIAIKLPTGAVELIINTDQIENKVQYYLNAYDENMCLKTNPEVRVLNAMFV